MPLVENLMGLGMPAPLAGGLGNSIQNVTCTGSNATASGPNLQVGKHIALMTAASTTACAAHLNSSQSVGTPIYVVMLPTTSVTGYMYPPSGASLNGTTDGVVTLTTGKTAIFVQTTANVWYSFPLTP